MQLTDRRLYFTWGNARRRQDLSMFKDEENGRKLPRWRSTPQVDLEEKLLVWALWWALLHKIDAIVLILALLFVL